MAQQIDTRPARERLTFQEMMKMVPHPDDPSEASSGAPVKRYMSQRGAWHLGADLPFKPGETGPVKLARGQLTAAFGGHVYAQAGLAAATTFRGMMRRQTLSAAADGGRRSYGIHTTHGYFSERGWTDRPYFYEVTVVASNPAFHNLLVTARQPVSPSRNPEGDNFPLEDAGLPLGEICFTTLVSFWPASPTQVSAQAPSPHVRFSSILRSRQPRAWDPAPLTDIEGITVSLPGRMREETVGTFPGVEMRKVDMSSHNSGRGVHERRELLLYRLIAPLPAEEEDLDAHMMLHAFVADRNGMLMVGNHVGMGWDLGRAASLSYSFVAHVNPEEAVMEYYDDADQGEQPDDKARQWWIQEASFPRVEAGRGIIESKIWSPAGLHVATGYQDGVVRRHWEAEKGEKRKEGKL